MNAHRPSARHHTTRALLITLLVAMAAVAVPTVAAGQEAPLATTTTVTVTQLSTNGHDHRLRALVTPITGPGATGIVVFTVGGAEVGRSTLAAGPTNSNASLLVEIPPATDLPIVATYLGTTGFETSTGSTTFTQTRGLTGTPATVTLSVGDATLTADTSQPFFSGPLSTNALTGIGSVSSARPILTTTVEVPGTGPVTIAANVITTLSPTVRADGTVAGEASLSLLVRRITVDGVTWGADCSTAVMLFPISGTVAGSRLQVSGTESAFPAFPPGVCGGRAALLNSILIGPIAMEIGANGTFPLPPTAVATTTTLTVTPAGPLDPSGQISAIATVTTDQPYTPTGRIELRVNGVLSGTAIGTNPARFVTGTALPEGPVEVRATYVPNAPFTGSTASTTVQVDAPPSGTPTTGSIQVGNNPVVTLPTGARMIGADFDPETGAIGAATLWTLPGTTVVPTGIVGDIELSYRLVQVAPTTGQVAPDGTVTFAPTTFRFEARGYRIGTTEPFASLGSDCVNQPIVVNLTGTADADGLQVSAINAPLPQLPAGACTGLAGFINPYIGTTFDLALEVEGDFEVDQPANGFSVLSWQPVVDQYNQTLLVASVPLGSTPPTGTVTFLDGSTALGVAPLQANGTALLAAPMGDAGTRTITATYSGDPNYPSSSATTTVEVVAVPEGFAMTGAVELGSVEMPIAEGSLLEPQTPAAAGSEAVAAGVGDTGGRLVFAPATVGLTLPGYGPVEAEVRLVQRDRLTPVDLQPDGSFRGLNGGFALHVRKVTSADGTTTVPLGCVNIVLLSLDGRLRITDATIGTAGGGSAQYRIASCTGVGRAVANRLANVAVNLDATVEY